MEFMPDGEQILKAYLKEKYEEGFAEGKRKRAIVDATNLLKEGLPAEQIARIVELPLTEIDALKAQLVQ